MPDKNPDPLQNIDIQCKPPDQAPPRKLSAPQRRGETQDKYEATPRPRKKT